MTARTSLSRHNRSTGHTAAGISLQTPSVIDNNSLRIRESDPRIEALVPDLDLNDEMLVDSEESVVKSGNLFPALR
jgi:hypothetical protein